MSDMILNDQEEKLPNENPQVTSLEQNPIESTATEPTGGHTETNEEEKAVFCKDSASNDRTNAPKKKRKLSKKSVFLMVGCGVLAVIACISLFLFPTAFTPKSEKNDIDTLFHQDLLRVRQGDKWGYINSKGAIVVEPQFDDALNFAENGLACVEQDNKYGYINSKGTYVINPQFDFADSFAENGLASVTFC